jgi:hypothetical protein
MENFAGSSSNCVSIQEKIQRAHSLYVMHKDRLFGRSEITDLLNALRRHIDATQQAMDELGIIEQCRQCDEDGGGSCCGAGIENKYDVVLLLINLLLGVSLPEQRYETSSCYFAGKRGCVLSARHVICVNYICSRIEQEIHPHKINRLQSIAGSELDCSFMLHEALKTFLNSGTNDHALSQRNTRSGHQLL